METKFCSKCGCTKSIKDFSKNSKSKDGLQRYCKECNKRYRESHKEKIKKYREENHEMLIEGKRKYRETHKEKILADAKEYRQRDCVKKQRAKYLSEYMAQKYHEDDLFRIKMVVRANIYSSFSRKGFIKSEHTEEIVSCTLDNLINHLLKTYKENYHKEYDWKEKVHIDHIIPLATAKTEEEVYRLCNWKNLQLLKAQDNLEKSDKLNWKLE